MEIFSKQFSTHFERQIEIPQLEKAKSLAAAESVAEQFETLYLDMMLKSMRQTATPEEQSNATSLYQGLLDSEYSGIMAKSESFGIRDLVFNWLKENDPKLKTEKK